MVDAFFKQLMEGIDLDNIRAWVCRKCVSGRVLTQNNKNQNSHYRQLIRDTVEKDILTPEKNKVVVRSACHVDDVRDVRLPRDGVVPALLRAALRVVHQQREVCDEGRGDASRVPPSVRTHEQWA